MSDLSEYTEEELQEEIKNRRVVKDHKPTLIETPDLKELRNLCVDYLESVIRDEVDDDMQHYIFESAIETFYGKKAFDFINKFL